MYVVFIGPLSIPSSYIEPYYKSYFIFQQLLDDATDLSQANEKYRKYAKKHTWEYKLKPKQVLIFNNRRMLHGRRSFNHYSGERLLVGCYTNIDDTLNLYRVSQREYADKEEDVFVCNVGNGTSVIP